MNRPTSRELFNKLNLAKEHILNDRWKPVNIPVFRADCRELALFISSERQNALEKVLEEFKPEDYIGTHPPKRAYAEEVRNMELFEFCGWSESLQRDIYLKFAINQHELFIVSFHRKRRC